MPGKRSIIRTNIVLFLIFAMVLLLFVFSINRFRNMGQENYEPFMSVINQNEDLMNNDDLAALSDKAGKDVLFLVYDEQGKLLYSSDPKFSAEFSFDDVQLLTDEFSDVYWAVDETMGDENKRYLITKEKVNWEGSSNYILGYAILDEDLNILEGDIFKDRTKLTRHQFELLQGDYEDGVVQSYIYENGAGKSRAMIYCEKDMTYDTGMQGERQFEILRFMTFPLLVLLVVLWAVLLRRKIHAYIDPIDRAMSSYGEGQRLKIDESELPEEFKNLGESFNRLADSVEAANEAKDKAYQDRQALIANISHDLRSPLSVIQGYSQAFLDGRVPEDKQERYMQTIYDKSKLSSEMIDLLFEFTKLDHPEYVLKTENVDLTEFCRTYLAEQHEQLSLDGHTLYVDLPEDPIFFDADTQLLTRLFDNLIGNSRKYAGAAPIYFRLQANEKKIRIVIADDGPGIPEDLRETLFVPFVTGNTARTSGTGTGLGMSIARRIVQLHGGTIRLLPGKNAEHSTEFEILFDRKAD